MRVHVLIENTAISPDYASEHGLSLLIETRKHRILFDFGQGEQFAMNAHTMGLDLSEVDIAVLSHGHYDHGGGIAAFLERNHHAPLYVQKEAFVPHAALRENGEQADAGLDAALANHPRIRRVTGCLRLDEEITLFSGVITRRLWPPDNARILKQSVEGFVPDDFAHELHLIISEDKQDVLFTGCAHSGIADILSAAAALRAREPAAAVGGFHLVIGENANTDAMAFGKQVALALTPGNTRYFTGHCTGEGGITLLQEMLPGRVKRIASGLQFDPLA
jgi:7,8-dihydropterin-6-yl-methyl-4-(beta-D-ribofuranosyl)aminobenzene 5'-phosphate synthase